jgi:hypothetical protein
VHKPLTAPARLALLLPWLNGDGLGVVEIRRQLEDFLEAFNMSEGVGHLRTQVGQNELRSISAPELDKLRQSLFDLLRRGFLPTPDEHRASGEWWPWLQPFPSLQFGAIHRSRQSPGKLSRATKSERRAYAAPGAYTQLVVGKLRDLVPFLVLHLLTAPGMAVIARCPAPAPNDRTSRCGRFLVTAGRGRPRKFCSRKACRIRNHAEVVRKQEEEAMRGVRTVKARRLHERKPS